MCELLHARQGTASDFTGTSKGGTAQTPVLQMLYLRFGKQNRLCKVMQVEKMGLVLESSWSGPLIYIFPPLCCRN